MGDLFDFAALNSTYTQAIMDTVLHGESTIRISSQGTFQVSSPLQQYSWDGPYQGVAFGVDQNNNPVRIHLGNSEQIIVSTTRGLKYVDQAPKRYPATPYTRGYEAFRTGNKRSGQLTLQDSNSPKFDFWMKGWAQAQLDYKLNKIPMTYAK